MKGQYMYMVLYVWVSKERGWGMQLALVTCTNTPTDATRCTTPSTTDPSATRSISRAALASPSTTDA